MRTKLHADQEANYEYYKMREPEKRMGENDFANMPVNPIMGTFSRKHEHRDGIINSYTANVDMFSDIEENIK